MSIEAKALAIAERIGWPDRYAINIRHASIADIKHALVMFSEEQNKELKDAVSGLLKSLSDVDDEGMMEHADPVRRVRALL